MWAVGSKEHQESSMLKTLQLSRLARVMFTQADRNNSLQRTQNLDHCTMQKSSAFRHTYENLNQVAVRTCPIPIPFLLIPCVYLENANTVKGSTGQCEFFFSFPLLTSSSKEKTPSEGLELEMETEAAGRHCII